MTQEQIHQLAEEILIEHVGDLELYRDDLISAMVEMYQRATENKEEEEEEIQSAIKMLNKALEWIEPIRRERGGVGRIKFAINHALSVLQHIEKQGDSQ